MHIDVVGAGNQIDGGEKDVAGEELLIMRVIGMGLKNVTKANWRYDSLRRHDEGGGTGLVYLEEMPDWGAFPIRLWPEEEEEGLRQLGEVLSLPLRRQEVRGDEEHGSSIG